MFSKVLSAAIDGARCVPVSVEVDASNGLPAFLMVGDLSYQVKEAQERVRIAIRNSGMTIPPKRVTVNLAPADVRKDGNHFDCIWLSGSGKIRWRDACRRTWLKWQD